MSLLISVIVPVCNAQSTLSESLGSVLRQTNPALDIIVVDDGSTDDSLALARAAARQDGRVRVISQPNGGVAAARNRGIQAARGEFIAPIDADDLWHPEKLERQLHCFQQSGPEVGLVYSWYRRIDEQGIVVAPSPSPVIEGRVLHRHLDWNFISNGSSPLIRTSIAREIGYDSRLRDCGNQGCEDYLLQLRIALRYQFRCAPGFLVGYRRSAGAMSGNVARMIRSHIQMYELLKPDLDGSARRLADQKVAAHFVELARNRAHRGRLTEAAGALQRAWAHSAPAAMSHAFGQVPEAIRRMTAAKRRTGETGSIEIGRSFDALDPMACEGLWRPKRRLARLDYLRRLDEGASDRPAG